ncbi:MULTISPECIES: hypothetical protein [unclassified Kitasatospora]
MPCRRSRNSPRDGGLLRRIYIHLANSWLSEQYLQASDAIDADRTAV